MTDNPSPPPYPLCLVTTDDGRLTVPCEPINDALAITPNFGMDSSGIARLGGDFVITHRPTGTVVSDGAGCIECCRSAGQALARTGVDWSSVTSGAELSDEVRFAVHEARPVAWRCDAEPCEPWPAVQDAQAMAAGLNAAGSTAA